MTRDSGNGVGARVGQITFYDDYRPRLTAGRQTIKLSQSLEADTSQGEGASVPTTLGSVTQTIQVSGPRFAVDPADVHRMFPPDHGNGKYDEYLPQLVLDKRSFPWERKLAVDNTDPPKYPWVALLVFTAEELGGDTAPPVGSVANPTIVQTLPLDQVIDLSPGGPEGVRGPRGLTPDVGSDWSKTRCQVIDVPTGVWKRVVPTLEDARLLTHVRQVETDHKVPFPGPDPGWFSTVIANRFCVPPPSSSDPPARNIVHLVSLEGFGDLLQGDDAPNDPGAATVRMVSLWSWSFLCQADESENFRRLSLDLIEGDRNGESLLLRWPPAGATETIETVSVDGEAAIDPNQVATQRLADGYLPLSYAMRQGEATFAWYRGPLAPVPTARFLETTGPDVPDNAAAPRTAAEAMVYDSETGLFDQSYAVAWQTGRMLALADSIFSTELLAWRRQAHALVDLLLERIRSPHLGGLLHGADVVDDEGNLTGAGMDLAELLDANLLTARFKEFLAGEFAGEVAAKVGGEAGGSRGAARQAPPPAPPAPGSIRAQLAALTQDPVVVALLHRLAGFEDSQQELGSAAPLGAELAADQIVDWLANRALLYGVPFDNLVASSRLLPTGSIRFFYIDRNWIDALLDGALSVGIQSSRDSLLHRLMRDPLHRAVDATLAAVRDRLRGVEPGDPAPAPSAMAGFLLRSALVSGWPGLEVRAWSRADSAAPMKPLRLDKLSDNVLIGIYPDVPVKLELNEPSEGLVFGTEDEGIELRWLSDDPPDHSAGAVIDGTKLARRDFPRRQPETANSPLLVAGPEGMAGKLASLYATATRQAESEIRSAAFAVEMVRVPERMLFLPPGADE